MAASSVSVWCYSKTPFSVGVTVKDITIVLFI